jgi:hypothetical protein
MAPLKNGLIEMLKPPYPSIQLACASQPKRREELTVLQGRSGSIQRGILVPHDEHRNLGPVLTLVPDLGRNEIIRRKALDLSGPQLSPLLSFLQGIVKPILINERRVGEAREDGKKPRVLSLAPDGGLSDEIRSDPSDAFPVLEVVDVDFILDLSSPVSSSIAPSLNQEGKTTHVSLVHEDKAVADQHPDLEFRVFLLGDEILLCELWVRDVDCDDLLS